MTKRVLTFFITFMLLSACKKEFPNLNTKVYGHAGESLFTSRSKYPPNTIKSIERALFELDADGVEVDVQMTADNELVLYHDLTLDDYTNATGCINDKTFDEVESIKVYNSDETIPLLKDVVNIVLAENRYLYLDIKHYNDCSKQKIDYNAFDQALNLVFADLNNAQKKLITVNSRDIDIVLAISDTIVKKSFESEDYQSAIPLIIQNDLAMITTKLDSLTSSDRHWMKEEGIELTIYNVVKRSEVRDALEFAPEFVISDNIKCTLKSLDG